MCDISKTRRSRNSILHIFLSLYRLQVQYQSQENLSRVVPPPVENARNTPIVILFYISKTSTLLNEHGQKNKCNGLNLKNHTNPAPNSLKLIYNKTVRHEHITCEYKRI